MNKIKEFFKNKEEPTKEQSSKELIGWTVFLVVLVLFLNIFGRNTTTTTDESTKSTDITIQEGFNKLYNNNYEFSYKIEDNDNIITYSGTSGEGYTTGVRINNEDIMYYYSNGINTYNDSTNEITSCYTEIPYNIYNLYNLYNLIKDITPEESTKDDIKVNRYTTTLEDHDLEVTIEYDNYNINIIKTRYKNVTYTFTYDKINEIENNKQNS